jgi:hypothetical protein
VHQSINPFRTANRTSSPVLCRFSFSITRLRCASTRVDAQLQRRCGLFVRFAFGYMLKHLAFAGRQQVQGIGYMTPIVAQHSFRNGGTEAALAPRHRANGGHQVDIHGIL